MRQKFTQAIDQFFKIESGGSRTGRELSCHLAQLTFALGRFSFRFPVADESPRSLMRFEQAAQFQFAVSAHYRVGVDGEIDRKLTNRGELITGSERSGRDAGPHLIDELSINGNASVQVEREPENVGVGPHVT